jgi:hypothetical protein
MKSFKEYLTEAAKTFDYRIKILGDTDAKFMNGLEDKLKQFDVISMSDPKRTPVQKTLPDFPEHQNDSMTIIDVKFNYPATPPQIIQIAELLGHDPNKIKMVASGWEASEDYERAGYEAQPASVLADTDYPEPNAEQKDASEYYGTDPLERQVINNEYASDFTIAGGNTPPAEFNTDKPAGTDSPIMGTNKIPSPVAG